jgi:K+-sensing histidine kinase KdpD
MEGSSTSEEQIRGRNLLLATDGKPHSLKAIRYAIEMAKLTSSKLFVVYVVSPRNESEKSDLTGRA